MIFFGQDGLPKRAFALTAAAMLWPFVIGHWSLAGTEPVRPVDLFNGKDLSGWVNVNGAPATWQVRDGMIVCSGTPRGFLRTTQM